MRIYLVRHGKASKDPSIPTDAERPLTSSGCVEVERAAQFVAETQPELVQIRHSGLLRAQQTAEIMGEVLRPRDGVIAVRGLHYADPVDTLARELYLEPEPIMLVGHSPFMEKLSGALLTHTPGLMPLWFTTSTVACFDYANGMWSLRWMLNREFLKD